MVLWVIPGSPAERNGIFPRDLIVYIDYIFIQPNDTWYYDYLLEHPLIYTAFMHIFAGGFLVAALYFFFIF